ncbi:hypothetical protein EVAR_63892_1 [Eumeta japonica]|uniref:Uncharacterized protein n=1 Tax=Eumeta variegata TaxID=151549 RepID=A0A4C1ZLV0_EUMVA|nr:hypothetical protein EVAR_63892_1 [Eumeta japonica]
MDDREIGEARGQKVVVSCSSVEDAKKIEERLKIRGADLQVVKPKMRLPTVNCEKRACRRARQDETIWDFQQMEFINKDCMIYHVKGLGYIEKDSYGLFIGLKTIRDIFD